MKNFLAGLLAGALLFSALPARAALEQYILYKADYRVYVNGTEYKDATKPVLNYKGVFYVPINEISEALGIDSTISIKGKRLDLKSEVRTSPSVTTPGAMDIPYNETTGLPVGALFLNNQKNGFSFRTLWFDNETYICATDLQNAYNITPTAYDTKKNTVTFTKKEKQVVVDLAVRLNWLKVNDVTYYKQALLTDLMN